MVDPADITPFPFLDTPLFWWTVFGLSTLFVCAVILVLMRQRAETRHRRRLDWERLEALVTEKQLAADTHERLLAMVRRLGGAEPLRVVTSRYHFNECVNAEMAWLHGRVAPATYFDTGAALRQARIALGLDVAPLGQQIGSTRELGAGQPLALGRAAGESLWLQGAVRFVDEARLVVAPLQALKEGDDRFEAGERYRCRLWRENDGRYAFTLELARREAPPVRWTFLHTTELERVQERAYYRVQVDYATEVEVLKRFGEADDVLEREAVRTVPGRVVSLSAGGLALVLGQPLSQDALVRLCLPVPEAGRLTVVVTPVEVAPRQDQGYVVRGSFVELDEDSREALARFALHRQQSQLADSQGPKVAIS
jgi:c-di-GMP-binding flagellar brake protein YcgR